MASDPKNRVTRREVLGKLALAGGATLAAGAGVWLASGNEPASQPLLSPGQHQVSQLKRGVQKMSTTKRMPAIFLPHGGGPWPFTNKPLFGNPKMWDQMAAYMKSLGEIPPETPRAILVISAHWEEAVPTVLGAARPPMLYDYYGFPPETYEIQWPSPGAQALAGEILSLLQNAGIKSGRDDKRGFDHGTFVPLKLAYPNPTIPALQVSLKQGLDPLTHIKIGRALAPLREQGVFMIGSGMSYHNLQALMQHARQPAQSEISDSKAFDQWLAEAMLQEADRRETLLVEWQKAPKARAAHPREEHLIPLHVITGAVGDEKATLPYRDVVMGAHLTAVHFGS